MQKVEFLSCGTEAASETPIDTTSGEFAANTLTIRRNTRERDKQKYLHRTLMFAILQFLHFGYSRKRFINMAV